jgi:hypothetical protein
MDVLHWQVPFRRQLLAGYEAAVSGALSPAASVCNQSQKPEACPMNDKLETF